MIVEQWELARFVPYARNPRKNDAAVDRMTASIREFGFKIPVLARSNGEIVDGHLRLKAAQQLKLESVPVLLCDEWSDAQVKAFRLMVNRSANWAEWDNELLGLELGELKDLDFDLTLTGFEEQELEQFFAEQTSVESEWAGMPDFHQEDQLGFHTLKVHFPDQAGIDAFAQLLNQKITKDTRFIWFPYQEHVVNKDKHWISTDDVIAAADVNAK